MKILSCTTRMRPFFKRIASLQLFVLTLVAFNAAAQDSGVISGKIIDKSNNEPMIGANVLIMGTTLGAISDLDGNYVIRNVPVGACSLRFSYLSYQTAVVSEVTITSGKEQKINIALAPASIQFNQVTVTANALENSELAVINTQKNATAIVDGISAELINKNASSDGTDVLKRMTGVTVSEGKYAYIRGVGDRYNSTLLNGSSLPSTDPEKKSFSYDLFPANLIENLLTAKTATPDKPADFSGGLMEINTIEFPTKRLLEAGSGVSYNSQSNLCDFVMYAGGDKDWLAMDDGARSLPSMVQTNRVNRGNYAQSDLQAIGLSFKNNWQTINARSPLNRNFKLSLGNSQGSEQNLFGYVVSMNYANGDEIKNLEKNNYTFEGPRYQYHGQNYVNSVSLSAMLNLSLKLGPNHKFSLKNIYNRNADNETTIYQGSYFYNPDYRRVTSLRYISRSLYSTQLVGEHHFSSLHRLGLAWNIHYGASTRNEPDARRYVYVRDLDQPDQDLRLLLDQSVTTRFFGDLHDRTRGGKIDLSFKPFENPAWPNLKTGLFYDYKDRNFKARTFGFKNLPGGNYLAEDMVLYNQIADIFNTVNFTSTFIEVQEITRPSDSYISNQSVFASYLMTQFSLWSRVQIVTGIRFERSTQTLNSHNLLNEAIHVQPTYNDWLPSLNASYALSTKMKLRAAVSKTLARPEFREMAPFSYFDFLANELVQGNPLLKRSLVTNTDLRLEFFPAPIELLAISGFYKKFQDPIEQILIAASGFEPIRSYENADQAVNYGVEFELKKKLGFLAAKLHNLSLVANLSLIHSEIKIAGSNGFQAASRPLQGQADYIANLGLYFENFQGRLSTSLIYNKVGKRIARVGFANLGDIVELPRDQIDFNLSAQLMNHFVVKLAVKDLLNQDQKFIQRTAQGDKTAELWNSGRTVSLGLGYQL